jgi:PAS domain S-box-containing protein
MSETTEISKDIQAQLDALQTRVRELETEQEGLKGKLNVYESFFQHSGDAIFVHDLKGRFLDVNSEAVRRLGLSREELLGMSVMDIDAPEFAQRVPDNMKELLEKGRLIVETVHKSASGEMIPVELNARVIDYNDEKAILSSARDLRARKRTEQALEQSQERYRILFDGYSHPVVLYDREGKIIMANVAAAGYMGLPPHQCVGKFLGGLVPNAYRIHGERLRRVIDEGVELHVEDLITINNEKRWFWSILQPVSDNHGQRYAAQVISYEITAKKRAEEALSESRARFRAVFQSSSAGMCVLRPDGVCVLANSALANMLGVSGAELIGFDLMGALSDQHRQEALTNLSRIHKEKEEHIRGEACLIRKDNREIWVDMGYSPLPGSKTSSGAILMALIDITDRKEAEVSLKKSEQRHRRIVENITEGYYEVDLKGNITFFNKSLCEIIGYPPEDLVGLNYHAFVDGQTAEEIYSTFNSVFVTGEPVGMFEWTITRPDGRRVNIEASVSPITVNGQKIVGFGGICRDVTEQREARKMAMQNERLKAVAELAGGVSHNFNNLLQIVLGSAQLGQVNLDLGNYSQVAKSLEQIRASSKFGAETVKRLQHFAKVRSDPEMEEIFDLSGTVEQAVEMSRVWWQSIPERDGLVIELKKSIEPQCMIKGKESEIFEVVVNLVKNAAEALPKGGEICVKTFHGEGQAMLEVSDNGVGIEPHNREKIFQPFFTTKGFQSTGMGLAGSHGIIQRHQGAIEVSSEPNKGAVFLVKLPLVEFEPKPVLDSSDEFPWELDILAVDDLAPILRMLTQGLKSYNQNVTAALSGAEALKIFEEKTPDLVLCDLGMPGMNGWAICREIKRICLEKGIEKPPFIILTGWGAQDHEDPLNSEKCVDAVVEKPVDIPKLLNVIKDIYRGRGNNEKVKALRKG